MTTGRADAPPGALPRRAPIPFRTWRWLAYAAQALVVLGLPFVRIGGESALRLDVPAGKLHAFGASFAVDEAFVVLAATFLVTAAFLLATLLLGRAWCGWACPQTVLDDLTSLVERRRGAGLALAAAVSAVVAASLLGYFVEPRELLRRLASGTLGPVLSGSFVALFLVLFLDLAFLRARFCATTCPYARLQGVLLDRSSLVVAYDARRAADCVDCGACVRPCPTGIDIRGGLQMECIACAACIDACEPIMARTGRAPHLVGYAFGEPGGKARPLRPAALAVGAATAGALGLLAFVLATRPLLDVSAVAADAFTPRRGPDGRALNAFSVGLENHGRRPVAVALGMSAGGEPCDVRPPWVALRAGERRQVTLVAAARGVPPGRSQALLSLDVHDGATVVERRSGPLTFVVPEAP